MVLPREGLRSLAEQGGATIVGCSPSRAVDRFRFLSYLQRSAMRTHSGILSSSVPSLSSPSVRPKRNVRGVSCSRFEEIQRGATVDRVTADGTVMFELWRASRTSTPVLISLTPLTLCRITLAFHRMVWGWDSDVIAEDHHKFFKFISLQ